MQTAKQRHAAVSVGLHRRSYTPFVWMLGIVGVTGFFWVLLPEPEHQGIAGISAPAYTAKADNTPYGPVIPLTPVLSKPIPHVIRADELRLIRVVITAPGSTSQFAVISVAGKTAYYAEGASLGNGLSLAEVHANGVVIQGPDGTTRLHLDSPAPDQYIRPSQPQTTNPYREVNAEYKPPKGAQIATDQQGPISNGTTD